MSTLSNDNFQTNESVKIFPNPVNNVVYFDNEKVKLNSIEIYSITGKMVLKTNFNSFKKEQKIDVSKLKSGLYFLKINNKTIKFIKN